MMIHDKSQKDSLAARAAEGGTLADLVLDAWQRTRLDWAFATDVLAQMFRRERSLHHDERQFIAETLFGLIRNLRRIDEALRVAGVTATQRAPDRARLLALLVLEGSLPVSDAARHLSDIDWQKVATIDERLAAISDPVRRTALRWSLPDWLARMLVDDFAGEAEALAEALGQRAPMTIRTNLLAGTRDELATALAGEGIETTPGRLSDTALVVETRTNLFGLAAFKEGRFEAQDEGSQLIAELVAPPPKGRVVDFCAGAGGKTLAIAAAMGNRGRIVATDVDERKLKELRRRVRRAGVTTVQSAVLGADGTFPVALTRLEGQVDRVLVDAPCSGIGALRRNPEARWRLTPEDVRRMPAIQTRICSAAVSLLAEGGRLIYATCTVLGVENRNVVERVLAAHPGLELVPIKEIWGSERAAQVGDPGGTYLELLPHRHGTDGFFAAVLRRRRS